MSDEQEPRNAGGPEEPRGPDLVAYGLCALAVGALVALLLRRALPALGVSVAVTV